MNSPGKSQRTALRRCKALVELQQADNDYAVSALVQRLSNSQTRTYTRCWRMTEDGADHVDAHRSIFFVAGPYVKHGAVVSKAYTTVNLIRTIEDILGTDHLNIHTATAAPMTDLFDLGQKGWTFKAIASEYLKTTQLPVPISANASRSVRGQLKTLLIGRIRPKDSISAWRTIWVTLISLTGSCGRD